MEARIKKIEKRLDDIEPIIFKFDKFLEKEEGRHEKEDELLDLLKNLKWGKKVTISIIAFLGSVVALALGIKQLLK